MKPEQLHRIQRELTREEVDVPDEELARLLGYPRDGGLSSETDLDSPAVQTPCDRCGLEGCSFRRSPGPLEAVRMVEFSPADSGTAKEIGNMKEDSRKPYHFPEKALEKWARQHLSIKDCGGGALQAAFSYHGTTCALSGLPLQFDYDVRLEKEGEGYRIVSTGVEVEDHYYKAMCGSTTFGKRFRGLVEADLPLQGELLDSIFRWQPEMSPAGCLCLQSHRDHKWRLVFETIHFSLEREE